MTTLATRAIAAILWWLRLRTPAHLLAWLAVSALVLAQGPAQAQTPLPPRIALIIANGDYAAAKDRLFGPLNDAELLRNALQEQGFSGIEGDRVPTVLKNSTREQIRQKVRAFKVALEVAGPLALGFLYYAGHGGADAAGNDNYLLPIDTPDVRTAALDTQGVGVRDITSLLSQIGAERQTAIVIVVDACRTPPGAASEGRGAAPVRPMVMPDNGLPKGMLVALSTGPGQSAPDSGIYAKVLADRIKASVGMPIAGLFDEVMREVARESGQKQIPVLQSQIVANVCLGACGSQAQADAWPALKAAMDVRAAGDIGQVAAIGRLVRDKRSFSGLDLRGLYLAGAVLDGADFETAELTGANLEGASLSGAHLVSTDLRFAKLAKIRSGAAVVDATRARFHFALADGAQFAAWVAPQSSWSGASLRGADFHGAKLAGANFALSDLRDADFRDADLSGAFFAGALVGGARFEGARLANTDFSGTVGEARQFTGQQQAGVCGHGNEGGVRLVVRRVSHSAQSSTGLSFDTLIDDWLAVADGLKMLDPCDARKLDLYGRRAVDDYGYQFVGEFKVDLPAALLDQAQRGHVLVERAREMVERLNAAYKAGPIVHVVGTKQTSLLAVLKTNAKETRLETQAVLDRDAARLVALRYEPTADAYFGGWESMAADWARSEQSHIKDQKQYRNQWHAFYPPGLTPSQLTPDVIDVFKQWTLGRARAYPQSMTLQLMDLPNLRVAVWRAAADKTPTAPDVTFKPLWNHLETEPYPASMREFVRPDRRCLPLWTDGERSVVLRLPKGVDDYEVRLARSPLAAQNGRSVGVQMQLHVRGSQIVKRGAQSAQFIDVDVEDLRLLADDGKPIS